MGESERMVKVMFAVARAMGPSVMFIDEVDALLSRRGDKEEQGIRSLKTEILMQWDGFTQQRGGERVLVVGATNRPWDLDEAARRRFEERLLVSLPSMEDRVKMIADKMKELGVDDHILQDVGSKTEGFSGADIRSLCRFAAMGPVKSMTEGQR